MQLTAICRAQSWGQRYFTQKVLRVMKLTAIILLGAGLAASAKGISQTVTLDMKNVPVQNVFKEVIRQTGISIIYNEALLEDAPPVTINVKNVPLKDVLDLCLNSQDIEYVIKDNTVEVRKKAKSTNVFTEIFQTQPPPIDIKGRVVNEKGEPVIGATVSLKGGSVKTTTDDNGFFTLKGIDEKATLVITATNIEEFEVKVNGKADLAILNAKTKVITADAVTVNTGYQQLKPNEVIGSVVVINNKTLNQQTGTNILQRINNITTGVYFDNVSRKPIGGSAQRKTNITIRGLSSVLGPLDPLIVLDNFIYEGNIDNINPNDIESATILKDAAATSIYGARGGNGVIVLTSKKGRFNQKTKIDVNSRVIITEKPDLYYLPRISSSDFINVEEFLFNKGYDFQGALSTYPVALSPAVLVFQQRKNGLITAADSASRINALKAIDIRDQFNKYFSKSGVTSSYSVNLSGGSESLAWILGGTYDRSIDNLNIKNEKINIHVNNSYKPLKNLLINAGVYYSNTKFTDKGSFASYNDGNNIMSVAGRPIPYLRLADDAGNPVSVPIIYLDGYTDTTGGGKLLSWKYYPLENSKHDYSTRKIDDVVANIGIEYQVLKGLAIDLKYQYELERVSFDRIFDKESYYARDLINTFSQIDRNTGIVTYIVPKGGILRTSKSDFVSQNFRGQLNYNRVWNQHSVTAVAGGEVRGTTTSGNSATYYGYNDDRLATIPVDFVNSYPHYVYGYPNRVPFGNTGTHFTNRFVALYANMAYTFKGTYSAYLSGRKDGSNIFGLSTNDKWTPLWSSGLGWDISKEKFYGISSWLPKLKLRATYGYSGNVDLARTALPTGSFLSNSVTTYPYILINFPNNPSLRWEKVRQINFGVDFSLKNGILAGTIEYYTKRSKDLYGATYYDYTTFGGRNQITINVGDLNTQGVDIILLSKNVDRTFKWQTNLLFSYSTNKLTRYFSSGSENIASMLNLTNTIIPVVGKPLYAIAAYKWGGLDATGKPQGYLNGQLSTDYYAIRNEANTKGAEESNMRYIGPSSPTHFGVLINEFQWKKISAIVNISYRLGYYFRKPVFRSGDLITGGIGHKDFEKRWQKPGDEFLTNIPALAYPYDELGELFYALSDINVLKADHIRLQYINLAYTFGKIHKKIPNGTAQLYLNVANLGILWRANKDKLDPDFANTIPPSKQFTIGLKIGL